MKTKLAVCGIVLLMTACAAKMKGDIVNQKLDSKSDREIVLVKVHNDSRCPEGTECVWAGEVVFEVAAYENKKPVEQIRLTMSGATTEEVKRWFKEHLPENEKELKSVQVLPYPKDGVTIRPEDYYIKLGY